MSLLSSWIRTPARRQCSPNHYSLKDILLTILFLGAVEGILVCPRLGIVGSNCAPTLRNNGVGIVGAVCYPHNLSILYLEMKVVDRIGSQWSSR